MSEVNIQLSVSGQRYMGLFSMPAVPRVGEYLEREERLMSTTVHKLYRVLSVVWAHRGVWVACLEVELVPS